MSDLRDERVREIAEDALRSLETGGECDLSDVEAEALAREVLALRERVAIARALDAKVREIAVIGYAEWDADNDAKAGKVLAALAGCDGMRPELGDLRARLAALQEGAT